MSPWDPEAPDYNQLHTTIDPPNKNCSVDELMFKNWADKLIFVESTNPLLQVDIHDCSLFVDPEENDDFSEDWQEISGETTAEKESVEVEYLQDDWGIEGGASFLMDENTLQLDDTDRISEENADISPTEVEYLLEDWGIEGGESFLEDENTLQLDDTDRISEENEDISSTEVLLDIPCNPELQSTNYPHEPSKSEFQHTHQVYQVSFSKQIFIQFLANLASHF